MRAYDIEIESRRLHLVLDRHRDRQRAALTRAALNAEPSDEQLRQTLKEQDVLDSHQEDTIALLHWVQGREDVRQAPTETLLDGAGILGVVAGELACFVTVPEGGVSLHHRIYFPSYDRYSVSQDGWLVGIGTHPPGTRARSKTFRDRLLPVPFTKVDLVNHWASGLTLQLPSAPAAASQP
jgi:hypothetical protein